jgi:lysophospholipase L1-like esterase
MSCSGATSKDIFLEGQYFQRAQLEAVGASTELVTLTVGGNDVQYLSNLIAKTCPRDPSILASLLRTCVATSTPEVNEHFRELEANLLIVVREIRSRSPHARILFVDYLDVLPAQGTCKASGLNDDDVEALRSVGKRLKATNRIVAAASNTEAVDPNDTNTDHSVCSNRPWVNARFPKGFLIAPFHPNAAGMTAVASAIDKYLGPDNRTSYRRPLGQQNKFNE